MQTQARLNPSTEGEGVHEIPPLAEDLLANVTSWEMGSLLSLRLCLLVPGPHSTGCLHTQEYMNNTHITHFLYKKGHKIG